MSTAPYGTWSSIVTPDLVTAGGVRLGSPCLDGDALYWLESHPEEGGRVGLWRRRGEEAPEPVLPGSFNVRSRLYEYGGGAYAVRDGVVVFSHFADDRLYRLEAGTVTPLTPEDSRCRYADLRVHPDRDLVLAVREDHAGRGEPVTTIVGLDLHGVGAGTVLCGGADFYADPELSEDADLAWIEWDHPAMPWDATRLRRGRLVDGEVIEVAEVAGGAEESVLHPRWAPGGELIFVSDRTDWWNLYAVRDGVTTPLWPDPAEYAMPPWSLGDQPYVPLGSDRLLVSRISDGVVSMAVLDRRSNTLRPVLTDGLAGRLTAVGDRAATVIEAADRPSRLAMLDLTTETWTDVRQAAEQPLSAGWVSVPRPVSWPSSLAEVPGDVHGFYYPPTNPDVSGPQDGAPPMITLSHGGPTGSAGTGLDLSRQYWTSRGFAILDVDYRGSTGYGRDYRDALRGRWGIVDVADCAAGAQAMVARGLADPDRLVVRGGSAGGYTTLQTLTTSDAFTAGISLYGVADLEALARDTHKFESRYLDGLVGPYPAAAAVYAERSPLHHVDRLAVPLLLLQGAEDAVVPPNQAETMAAAVRAKGLPVALVVYPGEGHGFRRAETIVAALEAQLYFLGRVFGFTPADRLPEIEIENL